MTSTLAADKPSKSPQGERNSRTKKTKKGRPDAGNGSSTVNRPAAARTYSAKGRSAKRAGHTVYTVLGLEGSRKAEWELVSSGLKVQTLENLSEHMAIKPARLWEGLLGYSPSTLARRKKSDDKTLTTEESDKVVRFARLLVLAIQMLDGDEEAARRWVNSKLPALGNKTPLEMAATEAGARRVEDIISGLSYGMFS
jgi:putative toxin-antitoxin system antitoxin component (TIGR02293 family)